MAANPARVERAALCDLFAEVGPDAPTLCGEWTTRDLAAHLVMRERRPDGALGIVLPAVADHAAKVQDRIAATDWRELIELVRSGPPIWSPTKLDAVDRLANTGEFFVHHEDVRRAGEGWEPRDLDDDLVAGLDAMVRRLGPRLVRSSPVGIVLEPVEEVEPIIVKDAEPSVTVKGPLGELVLFVFGRQAVSRVELFGDDTSVDAAMHASFGI